MRSALLPFVVILSLGSTGCGTIGGAMASAVLQSVVSAPPHPPPSEAALAAGQGQYCQYGARHGWQCYSVTGRAPTETAGGATPPIEAPVIGPGYAPY